MEFERWFSHSFSLIKINYCSLTICKTVDIEAIKMNKVISLCYHHFVAQIMTLTSEC